MKSLCITLSAALLVATTLVSAASAQDTVAPVETLALELDVDHGSEPTWFLFGIGAGVFFGEYFLELAVTAATGGSAQDLERAAIPVAGPWLELAAGEKEWWEVGLTIYEGIMQIAGLTLMTIGLAWWQPTGPSPGESVAIHPVAVPGGGGFGVSGSVW